MRGGQENLLVGRRQRLPSAPLQRRCVCGGGETEESPGQPHASAAGHSPVDASSPVHVPPSPHAGSSTSPTGSGVPVELASSPDLPVAPPKPLLGADSPQLQRPKTRSKSGIVKPKKFHHGAVRYGNFCTIGELENV